MRKLKLIWDFKGPEGIRTAEHHAIHLEEFVQSEHYKEVSTGFEALNELHAIAFLITPEDQMKPIRDALRPHRGQVYNG